MQSGMMSLGIVDSHAVNIDFFLQNHVARLEKGYILAILK